MGYFRTWRLQPGHTTIFPNFRFLNGNNTTRIWHLRGPSHTEVWSFNAVDKAASEEAKRACRMKCTLTFALSGLLEQQDDMENWRNVTDAGKSFQARKYLQEISMGINHEWENPGLPCRSVPTLRAEINQRSMYLCWQELMNADSWADISSDSVTAKFEAAATMKGWQSRNDGESTNRYTAGNDEAR